MNDSKELFDYWHGQVKLDNFDLIADPSHVQTQTLRHDCTNYDFLRGRQEVKNLDEPERSRVIAVIKYECTAQVLQRRAGILKDRITELQQVNAEVGKDYSRLAKLLKALQEQLFGQAKKIKGLNSRISALEVENESLRVEVETEKAHSELLQEFEELKKKYTKVEKRRKELAKSNQSLGGRVAHTNRFRRERDEAKELVKELRLQLTSARQENQTLREENESLRANLDIAQRQNRGK